jgi:dihydrofolate reductase
MSGSAPTGSKGMRKLLYSMMVSVDGFVETPDHRLDWVIIDEELHQYVNNQQRDVDTWIYGRRMYELMSEYWPTADRDLSAPGYIAEFARIWRDMPKVVFSRTLERVDWNSRLERGDAARAIATLKAQPGKDLSVGGASIAASLIREGLVDEYRFFIHPAILGRGTRMLPELDERINVQLAETKTFASGVVLLTYRTNAG